MADDGAWRCPMCLLNFPHEWEFRTCPQCEEECRYTQGEPTVTVREARDMRAGDDPILHHETPKTLDPKVVKFNEYYLKRDVSSLMDELDEWAKLPAPPWD